MAESSVPDTHAVPVVGVELGGTKCICTLGFGPGRIIDQQTVETLHPGETIPALQAILQRWWNTCGFRALGVASFGPICLDRALPAYGHILATTKIGWSGFDVLGALTHRFPVPIGFDTDVNAAALAEIAWGSGQGLADFAYVTVGTGIGVGLIVNGASTRGLLHSELGHAMLPRSPGDLFAGICSFHRDCAEGLASGSAIKARLGAEDVSAIAADHPVWSFVIDTLAGLCHTMVCAVGPQRIAFGGGVINRQPHLVPRIEARLKQIMAGYMPLPDRDYIVEPALGGDAGPLGAIFLGIAAERACARSTDPQASPASIAG
ncbi:MAG: ROK family protein [Novosphingobium sp.]|nr:ROK family protein [Novosphingobium sp.]